MAVLGGYQHTVGDESQVAHRLDVCNVGIGNGGGSGLDVEGVGAKHQLSYLFKDMPRDTRDKGLHMLAAALIKFALGAFLYNEIYEYIVGRRPALDPIGMLNDTVGDLTGWELPNLVQMGTEAANGELTEEDFRTEQGDLYDAATGLGGNVAESLPFV